MAVSLPIAHLLVQSCRTGMSLEHTVTLGRQDLAASPSAIAKLLKSNELWPSGLSGEKFYERLCQHPYVLDPLLYMLGAKKVSSADYSDYEGANILINLNKPVGSEHKESFDLVFDGGALEHVFNFPVAIQSCMEMVKPGGRLIITTTANNYCGHGFYQFSPELFFSVFSEENGFEVERMVAFEHAVLCSTLMGRSYCFDMDGGQYEVSSPQQLKERVQLINDRPVLLYVQARRTQVTPIFREYPQQSDYMSAWSEYDTTRENAAVSRQQGYLKRWLVARLGLRQALDLQFRTVPFITRFLDPFRYRRAAGKQSFLNRKFYRPTRR